MYVYTRKHVLTMAIYVSISKVASLYAHIIFKTFVTILKMANVIELNPYNIYRERSSAKKTAYSDAGQISSVIFLEILFTFFCIYQQIGLSNKERKCKALKTAFCSILI